MRFIYATMCFLLSTVVFSSEPVNHNDLSKKLLACGYFYKILPEINTQLSNNENYVKTLEELSTANASLAIFISGKEYVNEVIEDAVIVLESELNAVENEDNLDEFINDKIKTCTSSLKTAKDIKTKKINRHNTTLAAVSKSLI